ncbi:DUF819 family protein [Segetibacter sp. 3557_3]|uniref:DUF819 family protein n=1 Tax=Segetibacter sp. 3557_3 TaxID=2547429 RepID=UPI001058ACBF|nr:DUF819 family protein [Segetibacter sp. 3557_3]TDH24574.1 DUF819 family protein [Segetibacter sp. 3557_3]
MAIPLVQLLVITNDAVVLGLLAITLAFVFKTAESNHPFFKKFYAIIPSVLLCYLIPSFFNSTGLIAGDKSQVYFVASRYLLPASLVLFTLSLDLKEFWKLRKKAGLMFITGTIGIVIGGPIAVLIVSAFAPGIVGGAPPNEVWKALATLAGTWTGGGANQVALFEIFKPNPAIFTATIAVDIIISGLNLAFVLYGAGKAEKLNRLFKADTTDFDNLVTRVGQYKKSDRVPSITDLMVIVGLGLGVSGLAHFLSDIIAPWITANAPYLAKFNLTSGFFWIVIISTAIGITLSLTRARKLEEAGASRIGTIFLYFLVATIGMQMDVRSIFSNPGLFLVGFIWVSFHLVLMFIVARLIKAPFFFMAVGSEANIGGAASAPIVASVFHPSLAPIGVLLAIIGLAIGTYAGYICGLLMQLVAPK